jgi:hypothetical protein
LTVDADLKRVVTMDSFTYRSTPEFGKGQALDRGSSGASAASLGELGLANQGPTVQALSRIDPRDEPNEAWAPGIPIASTRNAVQNPEAAKVLIATSPACNTQSPVGAMGCVRFRETI